MRSNEAMKSGRLAGAVTGLMMAFMKRKPKSPTRTGDALVKCVKGIAIAAVFIVVLVGLVRPAQAVLTLELQSGATTVSITDNLPGDLAPQPGVILFFGSVGVFTLNVTIGITDVGSATPNLIMDLTSVNQSSGPGTLTTTLQDTALLFPTGPTTFVSNITGTPVNSSLSYFLTIDGNPVLSGGPLTGSFADPQTATVNVGSPYTMTLQTEITANGASTTDYGWKVRVPEPSTVLLFGSGLLVVGLLARWRTRHTN